ncbi:MAG: cytochrome c, partial [Verrucomicrobia bacterium]|nr:cytochrome c [Verrucomicrobiota bacterium]
MITISTVTPILKRIILTLYLLTPAMFAVPPAKAETTGEKITYYQHIAPLFYQKCVSCHRPGEAAPFSLLDYAGSKRRSKTILRVVSDRYMPPWKPVPGHGEFRGSLRLDDRDVELIQQWVNAGSPEGNPELKIDPPVFTKGWSLGKPDLIVEMEDAFEVHAEGRDIYRYFTLPLNLTEDKWVRAVEIRPSARTVVHHALFFLDNTGNARKLQKADSLPGFKGKGFKPTGSLGAWAVGGMPLQLGKGFSLPLPKGSDLILQTHFHPSGKVEKEKTKVGIYFADSPPERLIGQFQIPPNFGSRTGLTIAPGDNKYTIKDHLTVPDDLELVTVWAHAHQIGKSMKADATLPDGKILPLFYIDDWDFNWQGQYQYETPITL